jgi:membrane-associated phospholipid phosphatase
MVRPVPGYPTGIFEPNPGSLAERLGERWRTRRPIVAGAFVVFIGYLVMAALAMGLGLLLTRALVGGTVDLWDQGGSRWFVEQRSPTLNPIANVGSEIGATFTIIGIALLACIVLAIGRHLREIGFLVSCLTIEAAVSLTTSTLITRTRPNVPRLDAAQPTGSFPSGHTAATIVLYVSLALVITSLVRSTSLRILAWLPAIVLPLYVGLSRLYQGMHHPTDIVGSVVIAAGSLIFGLLACRTAVAVGQRRKTGAGGGQRVESVPIHVRAVP